MKAKSFFLSFAILAVIALVALTAGVPMTPTDAITGFGMASIAAFTTEGTYTPDRLIAANPDLLQSRSITMVSGEVARTRGAVLGKITVGTASGAAAAGNTGGATIGTVSTGVASKPGVYKAVVIEPGTDLGQFAVYDPDGIFVGKGTVGTAFSLGPTFTITDSGTDLVPGDSFNITVAAGTGKYKLSAAAATDGSQVPEAVLAHDADASGGDVVTLAYFRGDFNENSLTLGSGHTVASIREGLRAKGITIVTPAVDA